MKGIRSFFHGLAWQNLWIATVLWIFNLMVTVPLYFIVYRLLTFAAGHSLFGETIQTDTLLTFLSDLTAHHPGGTLAALNLAGLLLLFQLPFSLFISAGVYSVLVNDEKASILNLISSAIENFIKFLKLFFINLLNWALAVLVAGFFLLLILRIYDSSASEGLLNIMLPIWLFLCFILYLYTAAVYDFSKISRLKEEKNCIISFWRAIRFILTNKVAVLLLFLSYLLLLATVHILYSLLLGTYDDMADRPLIILALILQLMIWVKAFLKITLIRGQVYLKR